MIFMETLGRGRVGLDLAVGEMGVGEEKNGHQRVAGNALLVFRENLAELEVTFRFRGFSPEVALPAFRVREILVRHEC